MIGRGQGVGQVGFTLIEILMVVAIIGIMLLAGMPSFISFIAKTRVSGAANAFLGDISYARSEAATRQQQVAICVSSDQASCSTTQTWDTGRLIFVDANADGALNAGETVLRVSQAMSSTNVTVSGFGSSTLLSFRPFGGLTPATAGSITLCPTSGSHEGRIVAVAATGRPLITKKTDCP